MGQEQGGRSIVRIDGQRSLKRTDTAKPGIGNPCHCPIVVEPGAEQGPRLWIVWRQIDDAAPGCNLFGPNRDREWYVLFAGDVRTPADDNCRQLMIEMTRMANDWRSNMSRVEDTARKNDVTPGAMREIRERYRVDF